MRFYYLEEKAGELWDRVPWKRVGLAALLAWAGAWAWHWWA